MTIQDWGAVGEVVSAVAVLATLIYLAIQIKQNTAATRAQIHQARSEQAQDFLLFGAGSKDFSSLVAKVRNDLSKLTELDEGELQQITFWSVAGMQRQQNMYFQKESGFLSEELYENQKRVIARAFPLWDALGVIHDDTFGQEARRIYEELGG